MSSTSGCGRRRRPPGRRQPRPNDPLAGDVAGTYRDPERYLREYWSRSPGRCRTGGSARVDEDGFFWIIGRTDDVIKVSGYRLGTAEIESTLVSHPAVSEAAAIRVPHEVKGHAIRCYVLLRAGVAASAELAQELADHVAREVGPIARPAAGAGRPLRAVA